MAIRFRDQRVAVHAYRRLICLRGVDRTEENRRQSGSYNRHLLVAVKLTLSSWNTVQVQEVHIVKRCLLVLYFKSIMWFVLIIAAGAGVGIGFTALAGCVYGAITAVAGLWRWRLMLHVSAS